MEHKLGETFEFKGKNISINKGLVCPSCWGCMFDDGYGKCNKPVGIEDCIGKNREDGLDIIFIKQ